MPAVTRVKNARVAKETQGASEAIVAEKSLTGGQLETRIRGRDTAGQLNAVLPATACVLLMSLA